MTQFLSFAMCAQALAGRAAAIGVCGGLQALHMNVVAPPGAGVS